MMEGVGEWAGTQIQNISGLIVPSERLIRRQQRSAGYFVMRSQIRLLENMVRVRLSLADVNVQGSKTYY